jgi:hypothetical protein
MLNEIDRNLADAMSVARNVYFNPILAPGGGATEMAMCVSISYRSMFPGLTLSTALLAFTRKRVQSRVLRGGHSALLQTLWRLSRVRSRKTLVETRFAC